MQFNTLLIRQWMNSRLNLMQEQSHMNAFQRKRGVYQLSGKIRLIGLLITPTRDIAEWTRKSYFEENSYTFSQTASRFFQEYQSILPLSPFSWRILYSRLILPLHYFQCIEMYYSNGKGRLEQINGKHIKALS